MFARVGFQSKALLTDLDSILKAVSSLRMLAALSTKWLPPKDACCIDELYFPRAAGTKVTICQCNFDSTIQTHQTHLSGLLAM